MTTNIERLYPIVNGRFNDEITNEQFLEYEYEARVSMTWCIIIDLDSPHTYRNIDRSVFQVVKDPVWKYPDITPETVNDIFVKARFLFNSRHELFLRLTKDNYFKQGVEIFETQRKLGFSGSLTMDWRKLQGYITGVGSWNNFNHSKVEQAIEKLENAVPKFYRRNNPNNGMSNHTWEIESDYIRMHFKCVSDKSPELKQYIDFYKIVWQAAGELIKADSIRMERVDYEGGVCSLTFIWWWD
ncbi:MAG: hypothetical protein QM762_12465 [Chryseolinea sp.]